MARKPTLAKIKNAATKATTKKAGAKAATKKAAAKATTKKAKPASKKSAKSPANAATKPSVREEQQAGATSAPHSDPGTQSVLQGPMKSLIRDAFLRRGT